MTSRLSAQRAFAYDLRCHFRRHGLRSTVAKLGGAARARLGAKPTRIILLKELDESVEPAARGGLRVVELERGHLPLLYELNRRRCFTKADRRFAEDLAHGYRAFLAFRDDALVGYYWWVDRDHHPRHRDLRQLGGRLELEERDVYGSDFFVLEEHRGGGTADHFLDQVEAALRERGFRRLWGYVESDNRPARWTYRVRGYRPIETVGDGERG